LLIDVLIVVRHGETAANAEGRLLGRADPPLNERGRLQVTTMAEAVGAADRVVTSPLLRARQTAECFGLPVEVDDRWIEVDYGELEGEKLSEVPREIWDRWRSDPAFAPPGGESLVSVGKRVREACDGLAVEARDVDIVVVSHVSPIKAAVAWALGAGDEVTWRLFLGVAAITRIAINERGAVLHAYNDRHHLDG
jgi:broad specificity phosphatase PhoE